MLINSNTIFLGSYPQNGDFLKKEPIEWIVLEKANGKSLCISKFLLDCKPYHHAPGKVIWKECSLRHWLNHDFFACAFTKEEQEKIALSEIQNPKGNTIDQVFLLNLDEAERYFNFENRAAKATPFAQRQGAWHMEEYGVWWLRYSGAEDMMEEGEIDGISCVNFDGHIEENASEPTDPVCSVRPVIWLKE